MSSDFDDCFKAYRESPLADVICDYCKQPYHVHAIHSHPFSANIVAYGDKVINAKLATDLDLNALEKIVRKADCDWSLYTPPPLDQAKSYIHELVMVGLMVIGALREIRDKENPQNV